MSDGDFQLMVFDACVVEDEYNTDYRPWADVEAGLHLLARCARDEQDEFERFAPVDKHTGPFFVDVLSEATMWCKFMADELNRVWLALNGVRIPEWEPSWLREDLPF